MFKPKSLRKRLRNIGVPADVALAISDRYATQLECRGAEGALLYLRNVGDTLLVWLTGAGIKPQWVKTTKDGFPVFFDGCQNLSKETLVRLSKIARTIVLSEPSHNQVGKVLPAVVNPFTGDHAMVEWISQLVRPLARSLSFDTGVEFWNRFPLILRQWRDVQSVSGSTKVVGKPPLIQSLAICSADPKIRLLDQWENLFSPINPKHVRDLVNGAVVLPHHDGCVGEIHATQEGGGKLRMFAAPYTVYQSLLTPLHNYLARVRAKLGTDCTMDQPSGALWAQSKLQEGLVVHSVDLSTATCRFPMGVQWAVLGTLGVPNTHLALLNSVVRGLWKVGGELVPYFESETIQWAVGQPLGIRPSMSLFSLTHNLILWGLCVEVGLEPTDTFRVLGDDVVICSDIIHTRYREVMSGLGVPISESKSHSSSVYAEFAGFSIFPDSLVRAGQWRPLQITNLVGVAEQLTDYQVPEGSNHLHQLTKLVRFNAGLPVNLSKEEYPKYLFASSFLDEKATDPEQYLNFDGKPWSYGAQLFVREELKTLGYLTSVKPKFWQYYYPSKPIKNLLDGLTVPPYFQSLLWGLENSLFEEAITLFEAAFLLGVYFSDYYATVVVDPRQCVEVLRMLSANTAQFFWIPPRSGRDSEARVFRRLTSAIRAAEAIK